MEQTIINILSEKVSPLFIILFGSAVKGNTHKDSDVDIAFFSNRQLDKFEIFMIAQEIASKLNRDVDLIDLNKASTVFQAQIIHTGKVIYCIDNQKKAQYELKTLKMYAKLNEERSPILKNIEESGSIYE
jgi:uncharacterized protein